MRKWGEESFVKRHHKVILIIAIVVAVLILVYLILFSEKKCTTYECFQDKMKNCQKASYISEQPEASWGYKVYGREGNECRVDVKLLQAKKGQLEISNLAGQGMSCYYPYGVSAYPEKDLNKCHGLLKENLQDIIIKKLYVYVIENLGKIDEQLKNAV